MSRYKYIIILFLIHVNIFGQDYYDQGIQMFRAGELDEAVQQLTLAHEQDPGNIDIVKMIGQIEAERDDWGQSIDWMEAALELDPKDFVVHYYLALGYRESGKVHAMVFRQQDWNRSEEYFLSTISLAPTYKDVYYQLSILYFYQKKYELALNTVQQQVDLQNQDSKAIIALYEYFESFLYSGNEIKIKDWIAHYNNERNTIFLADYYNHFENYSKSDSLLQLFVKSPDLSVSKIPAYLSLSRLKYRQEDYAACEAYYMEAIDSIKSAIDAELYFNDVRFILSDEEYAEYLNLESISDAKAFFKRMWTQRNPLPAYNRNFRIQEHVRRKLFADKYFRFEGFRTTLNNPDKLKYLEFPVVFSLNNKYNDKGLIFIRHGNPDEQAVEMHGIDGPVPQQANVRALEQNESWLYTENQFQKKLMFHFVIDKNAAGNNWRLVPTIPLELVGSRLHWDPIFSYMYTSDSQADQMRLQNELAKQSIDYVYEGLNSDRHSWDKDILSINMPFYASTFRDSLDKTDFEVYYSLKPGDIWKENEYNAEHKVVINCGLYTNRWDQVASGEKIVTAKEIKAVSEQLGAWQDMFSFNVPGGSYKAGISVVVEDTDRLGSIKFNSGVSSYGGNALSMSSLLLADSISENRFDHSHFRKGLYILPNPELKFDRGDFLNVYFEIYNLPLNNQHAVNYQIDYHIKLLDRAKKNFFTRITEMFSKAMPMTTNTVERYSQNEFSAEYIALDLANNEPGLYELTVQTRVQPGLENFSRKIYFELK